MSGKASPRILLVEDNPGDARYIRELLQEARGVAERRFDGGGVLADDSSSDGPAEALVHETRLQAGLDRLETEAFDVVLLDLNLPDSDGLDTLATLRDDEPTIPVVVLTGLRDRDRGLEALRRGADEYLVKDEINPGLLVRSIYHAIERKAHEREQRRYETLIEESTDVNVILDPDGTIRFLTPSVEHVLGYGPETLVGENAFDYIHPEDVEPTKAEFETLMETPDYHAEVEFRLRDVDDSWVVVHARGRNLLDDPTIEGIVVYTHDITELKEYERRLEEQRERLAALNQLNGVIHGITEAVIDRSRREEIEQIACDRLAESDSYEFAWIGEHDPASRTVTVRAESGTGDYLEDLTLSTEDDAEEGRGPTGRAIRTGEIQTTLDVLSDPRYEPWRDAAEEYGFKSTAAIPIRHENTSYGVLNVYADRADAFRGEERTVVDHLGEIIGHAIAAAERKQALMSDAVVELEIGIPDVFDGEELSGQTIRIERAVPVTNDEFLLYGTTAEGTMAAIESLVERRDDWQSVTTIGEIPDGVRFEIRLSEPPVLSTVASMGGSVEQAFIEDGDYRLTIHVPQGTDVRQVLDGIREVRPKAEALARRQVTRSDDPAERLSRTWMEQLTDRQRTALEAAYFSGLFEWPRHSSGEEVAESLGVSSPTFHQHVRAAERKIFGALLEDSSFEQS